MSQYVQVLYIYRYILIFLGEALFVCLFVFCLYLSISLWAHAYLGVPVLVVIVRAQHLTREMGGK